MTTRMPDTIKRIPSGSKPYSGSLRHALNLCHCGRAKSDPDTSQCAQCTDRSLRGMQRQGFRERLCGACGYDTRQDICIRCIRNWRKS